MTNDERLRELAEAIEPRAVGQAQRGDLLRPGGEGVTELLLIRHAQMPSTSDPRADEPLTDVGREQAEVLAAFLARRPLHAVYASPTQRTRETAEPVARAHGLEVVIVDELREAEAYVPEGMSWDELTEDETYKELTRRFGRERRYDVYGSLREPSYVLRQRIKSAVDEIVARHPGQRVAIVTHGPVINAYVATVTQSAYDMLVTTSLTGVTIVLAKDDRRGIRTINNRAHFDTLL